MALLPAATARALLAGFQALGLDAEALRLQAGLDPATLQRLDGAVSADVFGRLWEGAFQSAPRASLAVEVGLAIPFGSFGALDYLAGSSADVASGLRALASHFRQVSTHFRLEVVEDELGGEVRIRWHDALPVSELSDEFTLAVFVGRFRASALGAFVPRAVRLSRPAPPAPARFEALLGCPVRFGCEPAALELGHEAMRLPLRSADPVLQATLRALAAHLELGATESDLESAVRARLRSLLPDGAPSAALVAGALGLTERTLQRRLQEAGTRFKQVLDEFREAEAERLLGAGMPLVEVALRLGFSDQTAWNRAFKRWKGTSPREWVAARAAPAGAPPRRPSGR